MGQPEITAADLAGLGPQNVSAAFRNALAAEQFRDKSMQQAIDSERKLIETLTKGKEGKEKEEKEKEPFIGKYSLKEFKSLPSDVKEYTLAQEQARQMGDEDFMSFVEWKRTDKSDKIQFLEDILQHPDEKVRELAKEMYGPSRISIGEKAEEVQQKSLARAEVEGENYFTTGDWSDDLDSYLEEKKRDFAMVGGSGEEYQHNVQRAKNEEAVKFIEQKLRAKGGEIMDISFDENNPNLLKWKVKWPSGNEKEVVYDIGG